VLPVWVIVLATTTAIVDGTLDGGGGLLAGPVVHVPPQVGGVALKVCAKPLKAAGAGPPERRLSFAHCAPHYVSFWGPSPCRAASTLASPSTKAPATGQGSVEPVVVVV
jgi:hypothetical protein